MPPLFQAVLFDFDGTLADSYNAITASVNHVRAQHGLAPLPASEVRMLVGHGLLRLMADVVPGGDPEADAVIYQAHHPSVMYAHTRLLPGAKNALTDLHAAGVRMAVCSNKPVAITKALLEALGIASVFDGAFGPEDAGQPKPDPAMVHLALERLGIAPAESLYVGDMPVDIETARNAGLTVWVVPTGSSDLATLEKAEPDRILGSMAELAPAILYRSHHAPRSA